MILLPAIDIMDGRAVRLVQGRFEDQTVYADSPLEAAMAWVRAGARWLHVVDLDGARVGEPASLDHLRAIVAEAGVPVEYGGGLRSIEAVRAAAEAGASRVILGTAAFRDPELLDAAVAEVGHRLVVSVDVRGGTVSTAGWTERTETTAEEAVADLAARGVRTFVFSNVDRDGTLEGPDRQEVLRVADAIRAVDGSMIYSGGIGTLEHLRLLAGLGHPALEGVIAGKALYERRFTVAEGDDVLIGAGDGAIARRRDES